MMSSSLLVMGQPITKIAFEGMVHVEPEEISSVIETNVGDDISSSAIIQQIRDDIRALWAMGYFSDLSREFRPTDEGVELVFHFVEKPVIEEVRFQGNEKYKDKRLNEEMGYTPGSRVFFDPSVVENYKSKLKNFYTEKAFPDTEISWATEELQAEKEIALIFNLDEGEKKPVKKIEFRGNTVYYPKDLKKVIQTKESFWFLMKRHFDEEIAQRDTMLLTRHYWDLGYLDAQVELLPVEEYDGGLKVIFEIEEGEPYTIGNITIQGNTIFSNEELRSKIQFQPGDLFSLSRLREYEMDMVNVYLAQGYLDTNLNPITSQLQKDEENKVVDIHIQITESSRKYLGDIEIQGVVTLEDGTVVPTQEDEFKTKDFVILREIELEEGEPLDWTQVIESDRNLVNLNYFKTRPFPDRDQTNLLPGFQRKPTRDPNVENLLLQLEETQTGSFSFGGGLSTSWGPSVFAEIAERNLFGYGLRGSVRGEYGKYFNSALISLYEPHIFDSDYSVNWEVYYRDQEAYRGRRWDEEKFGTRVTFGRELTKEWTLLWRPKFEQSDISPAEGDYAVDETRVPDFYNMGTNTTTSMMFGYIYDTRDFRLDPTSGVYHKSILEVAGLTDNEFLKFETLANWYYQFLDHPVFAFSTEWDLAYVYGSPGFLPIQERYFIGGANSIRGFDEGSIGEREIIWYKNPQLGGFHTYLGGEAAWINNAEVRYPLTEYLQLVTFLDFGSVWPEVEDIDVSDLRVGTGIGTRIRIPAMNAMIRLDFGFALRTLEDDDTEVFHFSFGQRF